MRANLHPYNMKLSNRRGGSTILSVKSPCTSSSAPVLLMDWMNKKEGFKSADLTINTSSSGSLSLRATRPIKAGESLVSVPHDCLITAAKVKEKYGSLTSDLTEWQTLLLFLIYERVKGNSSEWASYINCLPAQHPDHPLSWEDDRLCWLEGSTMMAKIRERKLQIEADYEALLIADADPSIVTLPSVHCAAIILLSRAFSLDMSSEDDSEDQQVEYDASSDTLALAPFADLLHHSSAAGTASCFKFTQGIASLSAHCDYAAGSEVFDSYGPRLSPVDLFLDYGFVDDENENHRISIDPCLIAPPTSSRAKALAEAVNAAFNGISSVSLSEEGPDSIGFAFLRANVSTDAELIKLGWRVKASRSDAELALKVMSTLSQPISASHETRVLEALSKFTSEVLSQYPSTADEDTEEIFRLPDNPRRQVLKALRSEKRALIETQEIAKCVLQKLGSGCSIYDLYSEFQYEGEEGKEEGEEGEN